MLYPTVQENMSLYSAFAVRLAPKLVAIVLQVKGGVNNIFDSFQSDLDKGVDRDSGYIYGPVAPRTYYVGIKLKMK